MRWTGPCERDGGGTPIWSAWNMFTPDKTEYTLWMGDPHKCSDRPLTLLVKAAEDGTPERWWAVQDVPREDMADILEVIRSHGPSYFTFEYLSDLQGFSFATGRVFKASEGHRLLVIEMRVWNSDIEAMIREILETEDLLRREREHGGR